MTTVVVATSIDNPLSAKDVALAKSLIKAGDKVELYGYLQKIPAEYFALPIVGEEVGDMRYQVKQIIQAIGQELGIPEKNRHFVDEILGPDGVIDDVRRQGVKTIVTHDPELLKQRFLSKLWDRITGHSKEVPKVVKVTEFVKETDSPTVTTRTRDKAEQTIKEEPVYGPVFGRGPKRGKEKGEERDIDETPTHNHKTKP